jgi:hypothetical protein
MFTKFTTTLLVGALALATMITPTQLRAGDDTARIIGGLAIGALIGAAIAGDNDNRRRDRGHVSRRQHDVNDVYRRGSYRNGDRGYYRGPQRGHNRRYRRHDTYGHQRRVTVPRACRVQGGHRSGYSRHCPGRHNYNH